MSKTQAEICLERHGFTNPTTIQPRCPCEGCIGSLRLDGTNLIGSHGFLLCGECGCTHCVVTTKDTAQSEAELEQLKARVHVVQGRP